VGTQTKIDSVGRTFAGLLTDKFRYRFGEFYEIFAISDWIAPSYTGGRALVRINVKQIDVRRIIKLSRA
jgi:hypothetical protein